MQKETSNERKLRDIMQDMGPIGTATKFKAETTMKILEKSCAGISYDEAIVLANQTEKFMKDVGPLDPAWARLNEERNTMLKWASALNVIRTMGRHDHELPVHALVSLGDTTVECKFYIPRLYYYDAVRARVIKETIYQKARHSSEWSGSLRQLLDIDWVEL